jgi:phospholipase/carboxylesterase
MRGRANLTIQKIGALKALRGLAPWLEKRLHSFIYEEMPVSYLRPSNLCPSFFYFLSLIVFFGIGSLEASDNINESKEKNIIFSGLTLSPASDQKPDSIVVLFHGYGDHAENFLSLGSLLGRFLPNTIFVALQGPVLCKNIPSGRQWFKASSKNHPLLLKEIKALMPSLNRYLDDLLKTHAIPPEKLALVGFSQGARVALHVGLRRPTAGIVAFSGAFFDDTSDLNSSRPPVLLIHGKEDSKAPSFLAYEAYKRLESLHVPVTLSVIPELGHDIDPRGLELASAFLIDCFAGRVPHK